MVWQRMGLLDDAIRDHLELKRRRGADPGEVAREQQEVLDAESPGGAVPTPDTAPDASQQVIEDSTTLGQETQELDMESVLELEEPPEPAPPRDAPDRPLGAADWADGLEDDADVPREIPGQERLSFE
jgi:hypothetical protein